MFIFQFDSDTGPLELGIWNYEHCL